MKQDFSGIFLALVVFCMIAYRPGLPPDVDPRAWFEFMVKAAGVLCFAWFVYHDVNKIAGLFLVMVLFSHYYPRNTWSSNFALQTVVVSIGIYSFIVIRVHDFKYALAAMCILALINVIFLSYQSRLHDPYLIFTTMFFPAKHRQWMENLVTQGIMANPNEASAFLALSLPAFFRKHWFWFIPFMAYGLICARSFNGLAAAAAGTVVYLLAVSIWWSVYAAACVVFIAWAYCVIVHKPDIGMRVTAWKIAIQQLIGVPNRTVWFTGIGVGNWKQLYKELILNDPKVNIHGKTIYTSLFPQGWIRLHNTWIESTIEMGLMFWTAITAYIIQLKRGYRKELILGYMGVVIGAVLMCSNSVFKMNAFNGIMIVFWCAYAGRGNGKRHRTV